MDARTQAPYTRTAPTNAVASHTASSTGGNNKHLHFHVGGLTHESVLRCYDALSMIEPSKKKGWEQARVRCCPKVLEHECCPCYFLLVSQSNPWDAAQHKPSFS